MSPLRALLAFCLCSMGLCMALAAVDEGNWSIVDSPNTSTADSNVLWAVTCLSASDCWAVGYHYPGNTVTSAETLIERWDGNSWAIISSPNGGTYNTLTGVTCVSASDCWAVGNYRTPTAQLTLTEHWNGSSWSIVTSPNASGSPNNWLTGVTCVSSAECWAVGYATNGSGYDTLIERWNGTAWSVVSSPNTGTGQSSRLLGVSCASASECWAVGYSYAGSDGTARTLIQRWNGTAWTIVSSPNALTVQNFLVGVTCVSASDCWAVGYTNNAGVTGGHQNLVQRWDGASWEIVTSPNATGQSWLTGVTCASASECWAVGYDVSNTYHTQILGWNGTSWELATSPNSSSTQLNLLYGVTCAPASDCWAVGVWSTGTAWQTLTVRHSAPAPPVPTSAVSRKTHDTAGDFDVELPLTGEPGIESRIGQGPNSDEHQVVLTFTGPASAAFAECDGRPATTATSGNDVAVYCTGVPNGKVITVTLVGVTVGENSGDVSVPMTVLLGDTTGNGAVNSSDISQTKSQSGQPVSASNFRTDVTVSGSINSSDISLVKSRSGTALP